MKIKNSKKNTLAMKQGKHPTNLNKKITDSEERYKALEGEYLKLKEEISNKETREEIEKFLKNQAFTFILTEGLLEKFLKFRESGQRTKTQEAIYTLVLATDPIGFWISA